MNASVSVSSRGIVLVVVESCIFLVLDLAALVGNALVCLALYRNISLRTVTNNFILSLALTDLLMAVLAMPLITSASLKDQWVVGLGIYCAFGYSLAGTSMVTVMLLAINRYFRIVRPTLYREVYSKKTSVVMAVTAWIVCASTVCVEFLVFGVYFKPYFANQTILIPVFPTTSSFAFFVTVESLFVGLPCLVIVTCYVKIYQTVRHHNTAPAPSSQGQPSYGVEETKITRILTVVVIGFYICWVPPFVTDILDSLTLIGEDSVKYKNFYRTFIAFASSVINPIIYATMSRPFRMEFLKILRFRK